MKSIGIDIGTTSISAACVEGDHGTIRRVLETASVPGGAFLNSGRDWERMQDPEEIRRKAGELLDGMLEKAGGADVIGLTGQMHGIVYTDRQGNAVSPLYTWQDKRGGQPLEDGRSVCRMLKEDYGETVYEGYGLATHLYNCRSGLVPETAVTFCTVMDWFAMERTGRSRPYMHAGNGAGMGLFDAERGHFRTDILKSLGVLEEFLPETGMELPVLGTYRGIPVAAAIGDNQAGFLGAVEEPDRSVLLNMGTGGQVSVCCEGFQRQPGLETRPLLGGRFLLAGSSLCGGRAYALMARFFRQCAEAAGVSLEDPYPVMDRLLDRFWEQEAGEKLQVCTAFAGTREDPAGRGWIGSISTENFTPEMLLGGVLEGMVSELYDKYRTAAAPVREKKDLLVLSGNGMRRNRHLQRMAGRVFGMETRLSRREEEAACGAALAGILAWEEQR